MPGIKLGDNEMRSAKILAISVAGIVAGAAGALAWLSHNEATRSYATIRPNIRTTSDEKIEVCDPFYADDVTKKKHPTRIFVIHIINNPFDIDGMQTRITQMNITSAPWTEGDPSTEKPYTDPIDWSPTTPLDLNLNLGSDSDLNRQHKVLIRIIIDDQNVTFVDNPEFAIVSLDKNKKMFCRFDRGYGLHSFTFMVRHFKPNPSPTFGHYEIGFKIPDVGEIKLSPIYYDPAIKNNG